MEETKKRIFIILGIIAGLIVAGLLIYIFFLRQPEEIIPEGTTGQTTTPTEEGTGIPAGNVEVTTPVSTEDAGERYVRQLARNFVERFGSYSNQNENSHIDTVLPLVTQSMSTWLETQRLQQDREYSGKTTKVVVYTIEEFNDTSAKVHVEVQEVLQTRYTEERNYRTGTVNLIKVDGEWKISGLYWND